MVGKLLIIDDEVGLTKVVGLIARQLGLEFRALNSSLGAVEIFLDYQPDVVIIDMIMPEKDGIDVLNEILLTGTTVKVILTSGHGGSYLQLARGVAKFHGREQTRV